MPPLSCLCYEIEIRTLSVQDTSWYQVSYHEISNTAVASSMLYTVSKRLLSSSEALLLHEMIWVSNTVKHILLEITLSSTHPCYLLTKLTTCSSTRYHTFLTRLFHLSTFVWVYTSVSAHFLDICAEFPLYMRDSAFIC